jgi:hypothetical protein
VATNGTGSDTEQPRAAARRPKKWKRPARGHGPLPGGRTEGRPSATSHPSPSCVGKYLKVWTHHTQKCGQATSYLRIFNHFAVPDGEEGGSELPGPRVPLCMERSAFKPALASRPNRKRPPDV